MSSWPANDAVSPGDRLNSLWRTLLALAASGLLNKEIGGASVLAGFDEQKNKVLDIGGKPGDPVLAAADGR